MMTKHYEGTVAENPLDPESLILIFPPEMSKELGWEEGDELNWECQPDGSAILSRPTEWVMVECVATFRQRYMVEVPAGKTDWAMDTVTCNEAKEFSQEFIGEQIISHRTVTEDEALAQCDQDNSYSSSWPTASKKTSFFTGWQEQQAKR